MTNDGSQLPPLPDELAALREVSAPPLPSGFEDRVGARVAESIAHLGAAGAAGATASAGVAVSTAKLIVGAVAVLTTGIGAGIAIDRTVLRHEPVVQSTGPYAGYFISATSLQNKAYKESDQRRYLDSRAVPFLVLPKRSAFLGQGGARLGDLAFVMDPKTQRYTFAVVGDLGPKNKLGEASIALAAAIKGVAIDPATVTGNTMRKLVVPQEVVTLVFPGAKVAAPYGPAEIAAAGIDAIGRFGGLDRLKQCAAQP